MTHSKRGERATSQRHRGGSPRPPRVEKVPSLESLMGGAAAQAIGAMGLKLIADLQAETERRHREHMAILERIAVALEERREAKDFTDKALEEVGDGN